MSGYAFEQRSQSTSLRQTPDLHARCSQHCHSQLCLYHERRAHAGSREVCCQNVLPHRCTRFGTYRAPPTPPDLPPTPVQLPPVPSREYCADKCHLQQRGSTFSTDFLHMQPDSLPSCLLARTRILVQENSPSLAAPPFSPILVAPAGEKRSGCSDRC